MKTKFLIGLSLLLGFGISVLLQGANTAHAISEITPTATIGNPKIVFSIGYASSSGAVFQPDSNQICKIWNDVSYGYLSSIRPQSYSKTYLIVQFTSKAVMALPANNVECEEVSNYSSQDRLNWLVSHPVYKATTTSMNSRALYIDGSTLLEVTLTSTPTATSTHTATLTSSTTATPTSTPSETETVTSSPTRTETETTTQTSTQTPTETKTSSYTSTATVSATSTSTETDTATATRTITRTNSATSTRTSTPTVTPVLAPDKVVPRGISTLHLAKEGHICYGEVVGEVRNSVVEFVTDYSTGIEVSGGGCFTQKYYNLSQVMRYLESKGIKLSYISLPRPTLTPSRTIPPTLTVARYLAISFRTDGTRDFMVTESGTVCWGAKVGSIEYKVVKFPRSLVTPIRITSGGCTVGQSLSAEDVFNYLRRVFNTPLSGFVDYK